MLMAELTTAVANDLPVKIILLQNNSLAEVKFEQAAHRESGIWLHAGAHRISWLSPRHAGQTVSAATGPRMSALPSKLRSALLGSIAQRKSENLKPGCRRHGSRLKFIGLGWFSSASTTAPSSAAYSTPRIGVHPDPLLCNDFRP
jgi:hypothetical protein